jgi:multidrug efflux pump subunit AcrA (membrane-fusion protein)
MKRAVALIGMVGVLVLAFLILGKSRSAEGPAQGGSVTSAAGGGPSKGGGPKGPQPVPVIATSVVKTNMRQVLEVTGSLKTDDDVQIGSRIAGKAVRVTAKEGDHVRRGQVLVQLDDRELRAEIERARGLLASANAKLSLARNQATWKDVSAKSEYERAKANLSTTKSRVQQAETNFKLIDVQTRKAVETAQSGVRVATERLSIVKDTTRKQELRQAQLAVEQATAQMEQAKVDVDNARQVFDRRQMLFKQDAIAKEEVDEAERRYKATQATARVAEAEVNVAREKLDLAKEGSRPEEVRIGEGQLAAAQRNLEIAQSDERRRDVAQNEIATARSAQEQAEAAVRAAEAGLVQTKMSADEINNARATIQQAQADIAVYQTQLADLTIRAPVSGVVSTRQVNVGEMVTTSTPLMTLVALDSVYFEAQVPELEVALLRPGVQADVTVDSIPGRKFSGAVREVIPVAERSSRSFRVRIAVLGGKGKLPAGGFARSKVNVGSHPEALAVSKDAVNNEAGDKYVWLIADDGKGGLLAKRQIIKVGLVDERYAEVLSGLQPGAQVVAAGSPAIIEGTPLSVAPATAAKSQ